MRCFLHMGPLVAGLTFYSICHTAACRGAVAGTIGPREEGALEERLTGWHWLQARAQDEEGQTLAEYGLIMAVIAVAVVVLAVTVFRNAIVTAFNGATKCLSGSG